MWDYIVLGQIPGTNIQVTFEMWLIIISALLALAGTISVARISRTSQLLVALRISLILQSTAYTQLLATRRHIQA